MVARDMGCVPQMANSLPLQCQIPNRDLCVIIIILHRFSSHVNDHNGSINKEDYVPRTQTTSNRVVLQSRFHITSTYKVLSITSSISLIIISIHSLHVSSPLIHQCNSSRLILQFSPLYVFLLSTTRSYKILLIRTLVIVISHHMDLWNRIHLFMYGKNSL